MTTPEPIKLPASFYETPEPLDFVLPNFVSGTVGSLVSPGGAGKSTLALLLAILIAGGPDLLEMGTLPVGPVAYLSAEDPSIVIRHRLHAVWKSGAMSQRQAELVAENLLLLPLVGGGPDLMNSEWRKFILAMASDRRLLILDTFRRFHREDENIAGAMAELLAVLEEMAAKTGCAILFLHHTSKAAALSGQGAEQQAVRGSSVLSDNVRFQAFMSGMSEAEAKKMGVDADCRKNFVRFGVAKSNYGPPLADKWLRRHGSGILRPAVLIPAIAKMKKKGARGVAANVG